jgi:outer membrane protein OmpA-like peptidoglycan-associated protein
MSLNCSDSSQWAIGQIGMAVVDQSELEVGQKLKTELLTKTRFVLDFIQPDLIVEDTTWQDKENWQHLSGQYIAEGGEDIILIGRFVPAVELSPQPLPTHRKWSYYYFDDIQVSSVRPPPHWKDLSAGSSLILKNIHFELDKATLLPASYPTLRRLVHFMDEHPSMKIEIAGHTDSLGKASYNQQLSKARADRVVRYLAKQGINEERLQAKGYGSTQPIAPNHTPKGRAQNRRVVFKILKK